MLSTVHLRRAFIGQGNRSSKSAKGEEGMKQAEQKEVLNAFRHGTINVLVATCIGEEGLDIPQVRQRQVAHTPTSNSLLIIC